MSLRSLGAMPTTVFSPLPVVLACTLAAVVLAQAPARAAQPAPAVGSAAAAHLTSATLEECQTATADSERSATLGGEMAFVPGAARMQMRIDVLERIPGETRFHPVSGLGAGGWISSSPGVRSYRYLRQVTNLSAPAFYRGAVHFRWLNARGHVMKSGELLTPICPQPLNPAASKKTESSSAQVSGA
jgi:hypothetical protein